MLILRESIYDNMTRSEKEVAGLLKELDILWTYEQPVFVWDENKRPRVWAPDFFLVPFGIYVEVCGSKDFDYDYRRRIFDKNGHKAAIPIMIFFSLEILISRKIIS